MQKVIQLIPGALRVGAALLLCATALRAQSIPFLTDDEIRMLGNEFSGDRAYEHIRVLTRWHRNSGMEGYFKAADYIMEQAKLAGLEDVRFIDQPLEGGNYTARKGELRIVEPVDIRLADIGEHAVYLADGSHDADVTAELVWIGDVLNDSLGGLDVAGKIVLTNGSASWAVRKAVWEKGALGVVSFVTSEGRDPLDVPDQIAWSSIQQDPPAGKEGAFAFVLPPRKGEMLKKMLKSDANRDHFATGKKVKGGRIVVRAVVDTDIGEAPGRTGFVEAWIRGSEVSDKQIVITAHLQEEQGSANDDGSGCANILEIARAFKKLIDEGKMPRPRRDIRFWWTDEIYSEYRWFRDNPDDPKRYLANIHQDMTGANQAMGSRVQHLIFAPHSITSWLDAIFESVGTFLIETNNGYLSASRAGGLPRPFTRPLYSTRGSRDGYNARFVPYFNSSDHMCFVEGAVGVPAVATINWDDPYIHSSDDDLFQIDQTQLLRNQFLIGSVAYILANARPADVPLLLSETWAQGMRRLSADMTAAQRILHDSSLDAPRAWQEAANVVAQGSLREQRALGSVAVFDEEGTMAGAIDGYRTRMKEHGSRLGEELRAVYVAIRGGEPAMPEPDSLVRAAMSKVPRNVTPLDKYFSNRAAVSYRGALHSLMRDETANFVDGKRTYWDIFSAVRAEQIVGGSWYYGTVTLESVCGWLDAAVEAGALTLEANRGPGGTDETGDSGERGRN